MDLKGKVAIVTGGATGIGRAIVQKLASLGATVVINYNSSKTASEELVNELTSQGHTVDCIQANVSKFAEAEKLINYTVEKFGRVDILVNNAGITRDNLIMRMNEEDFDQVIEVNLKGVWNLSKHVSRVMMKQRSGKIINISSVVAIMGNVGQSNYCASKAGVIGLTKSLARELAKRNITVNAVAPGFIKTKMTDVLDEKIVDQIANNIPLSRLGEPSDIANVVAFLASPLADYITGQVLNVDGGLVMQ
ncbi:MAG TPA: 3-oxoacyl-[acyl-carrier-protein] reductase [Acholeplasmataceae bacterium]|jgi:3-oxoacyl-[acyl-carrier protein] reductase|nr:3-oxoacyl-[acyl-carrier-protein] reductase [Acholeplasmataceae bacterium]